MYKNILFRTLISLQKVEKRLFRNDLAKVTKLFLNNKITEKIFAKRPFFNIEMFFY